MPGRKRDENSGKYTDAYNDEDFLAAVHDAGGMAGSSEVAEYVGCTQRTAYNRLRALEEHGQLDSRKVGNARLWTLTDDK